MSATVSVEEPSVDRTVYCVAAALGAQSRISLRCVTGIMCNVLNLEGLAVLVGRCLPGTRQ